jgi:capsular polysaccharide biosynthesis protein
LKEHDVTGQSAPNGTGFEAEALRLAKLIWKSRKLVALFAIASVTAGAAFAFLTAPVYQANALLMPKEAQKQSGIGGALAGLGGMSGMLANQFGVGNANMDRLEVIARGWELADTVIVRHDLLPDLFPEKWDSVKGQWKRPDPKFKPTIRDGIDKLRGGVVAISTDPLKNLMTITSNAHTADLSVKIIELYLEELNGKIREDVIAEARANQEFLQAQKRATLDPLILNKIQNMLGFEMEREMLVSQKSIDILQGPILPTMRTKPQRKRILVLSLLLGMALGCAAVYIMERPKA